MGVLLTCSPAFADTHDDVVDLFASIAAGLSNDNAAQVMSGFDNKMPDYDTLKTEISALLLSSVVSTSIEPLKDEGDEMKRSVDLDWFLELKSREPDGPITRRREIVHCELEKIKNKWRIVAISPVSFFDVSKP